MIAPEDCVTLIYDDLQISKAMVNFFERKLIRSKKSAIAYKPHYAYYKDEYDKAFDDRLKSLIDDDGLLHKSNIVEEFIIELNYYYKAIQFKIQVLSRLN